MAGEYHRYSKEDYRTNFSSSDEEKSNKYMKSNRKVLKHRSRSPSYQKRFQRNCRDKSRSSERKYREDSYSARKYRSRSSRSHRSDSFSRSPKRRQPSRSSSRSLSRSRSRSPKQSNFQNKNVEKHSNYEYNLNTKPTEKADCDKQIDDKSERERIHREIEAKLRDTLAKEGKVYPPPKQEASHPVFANDGSFLEIFKKMQREQHSGTTFDNTNLLCQRSDCNYVAPTADGVVASTSTSVYVTTNAAGKSAPPPPQSLVGRRRGGKILKTGVVAKQKSGNGDANDPKDFWSLYLAEVNKYKSSACESESGNRPLVK